MHMMMMVPRYSVLIQRVPAHAAEEKGPELQTCSQKRGGQRWNCLGSSPCLVLTRLVSLGEICPWEPHNSNGCLDRVHWAICTSMRWGSVRPAHWRPLISFSRQILHRWGFGRQRVLEKALATYQSRRRKLNIFSNSNMKESASIAQVQTDMAPGPSRTSSRFPAKGLCSPAERQQGKRKINQSHIMLCGVQWTSWQRPSPRSILGMTLKRFARTADALLPLQAWWDKEWVFRCLWNLPGTSQVHCECIWTTDSSHAWMFTEQSQMLAKMNPWRQLCRFKDPVLQVAISSMASPWRTSLNGTTRASWMIRNPILSNAWCCQARPSLSGQRLQKRYCWAFMFHAMMLKKGKNAHDWAPCQFAHSGLGKSCFMLSHPVDEWIWI